MLTILRTFTMACVAATLCAQNPKLEVLGSFTTGVFNQGAAEIVAYDRESQRLFVVNGGARAIDVLDVNRPAFPGQAMRLFCSRW